MHRCAWSTRSCVVALCLSAGVAAAEVRTAALFGDDMILQRGKPVPVWGWADAGATVTVSFAGQSKAAQAGADGRWQVVLDPLAVSAEPAVMTVTSAAGDEKLEIANVLVGDVWLSSGQSNAGMGVAGCLNARQEVAASANPLVRMFVVEQNPAFEPQADCTGSWQIAGPATTSRFAATGYFFARELQKHLGIPVGIVSSAVGGTAAECWTSREGLAADPGLEAMMLDQLDAALHHPERVARFQEALAAWERKHGRTHDDDPEAVARMAAPAATAAWRPITLPGAFSAAGVKHGGVVWAKRSIDMPAAWAGKPLAVELPRLYGFVDVYFNGVKIGGRRPETPLVATTSSFPVPAGLVTAGPATIALRVVASDGRGGILGDATRLALAVSATERLPLAGAWECAVEKAFEPLPADADPPPATPQQLPPVNTATTLFNGMIHPLIPLGITGVVWYQGESNVSRAHEYRRLFPALIGDWRRRWGNERLPFLFCQLAGYGAPVPQPVENGWSELREAQSLALALPATGMANLVDLGEQGIHPINKQDVGRRLALIARALAYGEQDVACFGPMYDSSEVRDGTIVVGFRHATGLAARPLPATYRPRLAIDHEVPLVRPRPQSPLQGFQICGADRKWVWADATVAGETVVVRSDAVPQPVAVRYAWSSYPVCNLVNAAGLPAHPFRTDDFPGTTAASH